MGFFAKRTPSIARLGQPAEAERLAERWTAAVGAQGLGRQAQGWASLVCRALSQLVGPTQTHSVPSHTFSFDFRSVFLSLNDKISLGGGLFFPDTFVGLGK